MGRTRSSASQCQRWGDCYGASDRRYRNQVGAEFSKGDAGQTTAAGSGVPLRRRWSGRRLTARHGVIPRPERTSILMPEFTSANLSIEERPDGIALLKIDVPNRSLNVLSRQV